MDNNITVAKIKEDYEYLENEILKYGTFSSKTTKDELIKKINYFFDTIECFSENTKTFDEYNQLSLIAIKLQSFLSTFFGKSRVVKLSKPKNGWVSSAPKSLSEEEIKSIINNQAALIAYAREIQKPNNRADENWHIAEINFSSEVLEGNINFASRIPSESYERLENIWLKDIKLLQAYYRWINRGRPEVSYDKEDFSEVCKHIRELLIEPKIKGLSSEFDEAKKYLLEHYIDKIGSKYQLKPNFDNTGNKLDNLIKRKSSRVSKVDYTPNRDHCSDYYNALMYVKIFYENIIPAVLNKDKEKTLRVLKAFQYSKMNSFSMINSFEIILAIYFLDADVIKNLWNKAEKIERLWKKYEEILEKQEIKLEKIELELKLKPDSTVKSRVKVDSWSDQFKINESEPCRKRFWVSDDRTEIGFDGVMLSLERKVLFQTVDKLFESDKSIDKIKYKHAINKLYVQSRIIHRETTL